MTVSTRELITPRKEGRQARAGSTQRRARWCARLAATVAASVAALLVMTAAAPAATGDLTQKAGADGCVTNRPSATCTAGRALDDASSLTVSPDGKNAYVASRVSGAVAVFDRDTDTGRLTQKVGPDGCITNAAVTDCATGKALDGASSVAVSPDGKSAYVVSFDAVAVFDRDTDTGRLTQKAGLDGCITNAAVTGCATGKMLGSPLSVAVSPDGKSAYVATFTGVAVFDRDIRTGTLTQKADPDGCIADSRDRVAGCGWGFALGMVRSVAVSPDGKSVYIASYGAVAVFDRDTATGRLTQKNVPDACIAASLPECTIGDALNDVRSIAVSPDGNNVYGASAFSVAVFDRDAATGALTQKARPDGCIGSGGRCADGELLLDVQAVTVSPDGKSAYVVSYDGVAIFERDTVTGKLTQKADPHGCIRPFPSQDCTSANRSLGGATSVTVSPDRKSVYVASLSDAVVVFDRQAAPIATIDTGPAGTTNDPTPTFTFSSDTAGSGFACELDRGGFAACPSPLTSAPVADGPHSLRVRAIDAAGNVGPITSREFTVDTVAPSTTITAGPSGPTNGRSPSFAFSADDAGARFDCRLDSGAWVACASPTSYPNLADGPHTFDVRATDQNGNTAQTPATRSLTVDTVIDGTARAKQTQKQKRSKIKLKVRLTANENLAANSRGKIKLGKRSYKLKPKTTPVAAGKPKTLRLAPKRRADARRIIKALKRGKTPKATLRMTLTDAATNSSTSKLVIALKR